jgi:hypothetical protein
MLEEFVERWFAARPEDAERRRMSQAAQEAIPAKMAEKEAATSAGFDDVRKYRKSQAAFTQEAADCLTRHRSAPAAPSYIAGNQTRSHAVTHTVRSICRTPWTFRVCPHMQRETETAMKFQTD